MKSKASRKKKTASFWISLVVTILVCATILTAFLLRNRVDSMSQSAQTVILSLFGMGVPVIIIVDCVLCIPYDIKKKKTGRCIADSVLAVIAVSLIVYTAVIVPTFARDSAKSQAAYEEYRELCRQKGFWESEVSEARERYDEINQVVYKEELKLDMISLVSTLLAVFHNRSESFEEEVPTDPESTPEDGAQQI